MAAPGQPVTVSVKQGSLRGRVAPAVCGTLYSSFQAIPYAKPPLGALRFKPPQPPEPWDGVRDASKEPNVAPQLNQLTNSYIGDEDCLYLNVYTPKVPPSFGGDPLPVMVWVHGGGFTIGSGNTDIYGPDYLVRHQVVVVTLNYRLGVLGFMSTGDSVVSGNMGLKDQVMALRWVKDNIAAFGGDPNNVTIFGESAGSRSCCLLMMSPLATGLFHRVICQSAVAFRGSLHQPLRERSFRLARHLGLPETATTSQQLLDFMRQVSPEMLVRKLLEARSEKDKTAQEIFPFRPTLEPADAEGGAFMSQDPLEVLQSPSFKPVPIIIGVNSQEGYMYLKDMLGKPDAWKALDGNLSLLVPASVPAADDEKLAKAGEEVRRFYLQGNPLSDDTAVPFAQARGDPAFVYPSLQVAKTLSSLPSAAPVYFYLFDVDAKLNLFKAIAGLTKYKGAAHADDVGYLFRTGNMRLIFKPDSVEGQTIAKMTTLWTNFAKSGNPTPTGGDPVVNVTWPTFSAGSPHYLEISNSGLAVKEHLYRSRMEFWDGLHSGV